MRATTKKRSSTFLRKKCTRVTWLEDFLRPADPLDLDHSALFCTVIPARLCNIAAFDTSNAEETICGLASCEVRRWMCGAECLRCRMVTPSMEQLQGRLYVSREQIITTASNSITVFLASEQRLYSTLHHMTMLHHPALIHRCLHTHSRLNTSSYDSVPSPSADTQVPSYTWSVVSTLHHMTMFHHPALIHRCLHTHSRLSVMWPSDLDL